MVPRERTGDPSKVLAMIRWLDLLRQLTKMRICLFATLSACAGFLLAKEGVSLEIVLPALGIFLLSCGSCALNQFQERETDRIMERTKGRPLPSGKMTPSAAVLISSGLMLTGSLILFLGAGALVCGLGLLAVFWYNGIYFILKRKTALAVIPGALIGAIPPAMGWVSGGGSLFDLRIGAVGLFFFIWQVPHFWLILLEVADDYERAGLPSLARRAPAAEMRRIIFIWILSTGAACLLIPLFIPVNFRFILLSLLATTGWLAASAVNFIRTPARAGQRPQVFVSLNIYAFLALSLFSLDTLLKATEPPWPMICSLFSRIFHWA